LSTDPVHDTGLELEIDTPFAQLAGLAWGARGADPVLALHGWLDNASSFTPLAPRLAEMRIVALDMPGHGRSGHRPRGAHYHFVDYVTDVVAAADALGWERFTLVGHSLGGAVGCFLAGAFPQRVSALVMIDAIGPLARRPSLEPAALSRSMEQMHALEHKRSPVYRRLEDAATTRMQAGDLSYDSASLLVARSTRASAGGLTWRSDPKLRVTSPHYVAEEQILAYLRAIRAPALLIRASAGHLQMHPHLERRIGAIPELDVVDMPGGHHLHMETPDAVAKVVRRFLTSNGVKSSNI